MSFFLHLNRRENFECNHNEFHLEVINDWERLRLYTLYACLDSTDSKEISIELNKPEVAT